MYFDILKKDLKRKKTMNIILLLFAILASMFVSSGLSNVITVMNGTDYFFEKAGLGDYMVITQNGDGGITDILEKSSNVESYRKEDCFWGQRDLFSINGKKIKAKNSAVVLQSISNEGIKFFDENDEELKSVKQGEVFVAAGMLAENNAKIGDELEVEVMGKKRSYKIAGEIKDAFLGSQMMGSQRLIISPEEFSQYTEVEELEQYIGNMFYIDTNDRTALASEMTNARNILFDGDRAMIKISYVMEMIMAMIVMVLSVALCLVSFVLLKFVISFTISEEFREIGVMKAIGIKNFKIRSIYMTKYFALSVIGGVIGFVVGLWFGNLLLDSVSHKMVLGNDSGIMLNIIGACIVIFVMSGFAYLCTGKIKKLTPVDAIRSGQTGERFNKKSKLSLRKSRLGNAFFMALNDVLSAPKRFITIILSFLLCSLIVFGVVEVADTMKSDSLISTLAKKSDVYINDGKIMKMTDMSADGDENIHNKIDELETDLTRMGMPGKVSIDVWYKYSLTSKDVTTSFSFQQNKYVKTTEYEYIKGSAPQSANEIAITEQVADKLDLEIGDTVTVDFYTEKKECMVVGLFQSMNQLGSVIRLHEDAPTSMEYASAMMAYQIDFDDNPDEEEVEKRIEKIKEHYNIKGIYDAADFCDDCMGVAGTMDAIAKMLLLITCIVVILVTILMERSFISDEKSQIALLKAIGFSDGFVIKWHVLRFMIVAILAEVLAVALTIPVTKLWCDPIWKMMGATDVAYVFKPLSLVVIYPGIVLLINLVSVLLTALYTRKIKSNDVRNIE